MTGQFISSHENINFKRQLVETWRLLRPDQQCRCLGCKLMKRRWICLSSLTLTVAVNLIQTCVCLCGLDGMGWWLEKGEACLWTWKFKMSNIERTPPPVLAAEVHLGYVEASHLTMCFEPFVKREHLAVILKPSALPLVFHSCYFQDGGHVRRPGKWIVGVSEEPFAAWLMGAGELWWPFSVICRIWTVRGIPLETVKVF